MIKEKYTLRQICKDKFREQDSLLNYKEETIYECPKCHRKTFIINNEYMLGFCQNTDCNIFVDLYSRKKDNYNLLNNALKPIMEEAKKHINLNLMQQELSFYNIDNKICRKYNIGYYPILYWPNPLEDTHKSGNVIFPMQDYTGKLVNIGAKNIGKENKLPVNNLHYCHKNKGGILNYRGIWNQEINIFLNPMDCLTALSKNIENSIFTNSFFKMPNFVTFSKVNIFAIPSQNDIIAKIKQEIKTKDNTIKINVYFPGMKNIEYWYQYFQS